MLRCYLVENPCLRSFEKGDYSEDESLFELLISFGRQLLEVHKCSLLFKTNRLLTSTKDDSMRQISRTFHDLGYAL